VFHQPRKVYIDTSVLKSLPDRQIANGLAEVIKHALIADSKLITFLEKNMDKIFAKDEKTLQKLIKRNCLIKGRIVMKDEKEAGPRKLVNFGHTLGHAIEKTSNFQLQHGEAIALGLLGESDLSPLGVADKSRIKNLIKLAKLPTTLPKNLNISAILQAILTDKKARKGIPEYVLLTKLGKAVYDQKVQEKKVRDVLGSM